MDCLNPRFLSLAYNLWYSFRDKTSTMQSTSNVYRTSGAPEYVINSAVVQPPKKMTSSRNGPSWRATNDSILKLAAFWLSSSKTIISLLTF